MKKTIIFLCLFSIFQSCSESQELEWVCTCDQRKKVSEFVSSNIKAANNMSDEEMEPVIEELMTTGVKLNCHQRLMWNDKWGHVDLKKERLGPCETVYTIYP